MCVNFVYIEGNVQQRKESRMTETIQNLAEGEVIRQFIQESGQHDLIELASQLTNTELVRLREMLREPETLEQIEKERAGS